ncbi:MAG: 6-carboxytetrahydropterin synthase QueD [Clostridiales bacterium]|nr:MAG: 6-carboxytetrahydropterin synthase QueD [Clostridiales bacterium]
MILIKKFEFDAAHHLTKYHGKCERPHGHTYTLVVKLEGTPDDEDMIFDFVMLKDIVKKNVLDHFDHHDLNDILENPSAENIAIDIWSRLVDLVKRPNCKLYEIEVWETKSSGVVYRGE